MKITKMPPKTLNRSTQELDAIRKYQEKELLKKIKEVKKQITLLPTVSTSAAGS